MSEFAKMTTIYSNLLKIIIFFAITNINKFYQQQQQLDTGKKQRYSEQICVTPCTVPLQQVSEFRIVGHSQWGSHQVVPRDPMIVAPYDCEQSLAHWDVHLNANSHHQMVEVLGQL